MADADLEEVRSHSWHTLQSTNTHCRFAKRASHNSNNKAGEARDEAAVVRPARKSRHKSMLVGVTVELCLSNPRPEKQTPAQASSIKSSSLKQQTVWAEFVSSRHRAQPKSRTG